MQSSAKTTGGSARALGGQVPAVVVDRVAATYRVYQDARPTFRRFVSRGFRSREFVPVEALRPLSFTVHHGESVGIVGSNGSGKSTLMRMIAGLLPPTTGTIHCSSVPVLLDVGAALNGELSGRRNIVLGCSALGMSRDDIEERMDDIIDFTGIRESIDRPMKTYSSGMGARLRFAIGTAVEPEIMLIDEALATGDSAFRAKSEARIHEIIERAGTIFVVSHSRSNIEALCSRALWIEHGRLMMDGEPSEVNDAYEAHARST